MSEPLIVHAADWPHGLRCLECDERLVEGMAYSQRLVAMAGKWPVLEIVCVPCGMKVASG